MYRAAIVWTIGVENNEDTYELPTQKCLIWAEYDKSYDPIDT